MRLPGAFGVRLLGVGPFLLAHSVLPNADGAVLTRCANVNWLPCRAGKCCRRSKLVIEGCPERFCKCPHSETGAIVFLRDMHGDDILRVGTNQGGKGIGSLLVGKVPC